jgi:transcription termination factor Rho
VAAGDSARPKRKRRRRRFGRKSKDLRAQDLLLPPPGRQALVYGESRAVCTSLLREIAGELGGASEGPDPIALLIDPSPEELADWKREAPDAELVVAAQARHAGDAHAPAVRRAEGGEDVILLVDSLTRLDDADTAKEIFDGGLGLSSSGSLTVVAALERASS